MLLVLSVAPLLLSVQSKMIRISFSDSSLLEHYNYHKRVAELKSKISTAAITGAFTIIANFFLRCHVIEVSILETIWIIFEFGHVIAITGVIAS